MSRTQQAVLAIVILLAIVVRMWGMDFGLPYVYHPDEPNYVRTAIRMVQSGDLNPHFFNFPSFLFYANALAYEVCYRVGHLTGIFASRADLVAPRMNAMGSGITDSPWTFVVGRLITLLLGVATVWLVYLATRELYGDRRMATLAALLAGISPTLVIHSHFITPDVPQAFWVTLAFLGAVRVYRKGGWIDYLIAGLAVGAAASTKYHGVWVLTTLLLAHLLRHNDYRQALSSPPFYLALAAAAVAFFVITPYALLDFDAFWRGVAYEGRHYAQGHLGMEGHTTSWYPAYMWRIEGPMIVLALLEIVRGIARRRRETWLTAIFPVTFYLFINMFTIRNDRTLIPILPFVTILAASWLTSFLKPSCADLVLASGLTALLLLLSVILPATGLVKTGFQLYHPDSAITNRTVWLPVWGFLGGLLALLAAQAALIGRTRTDIPVVAVLIGLLTVAMPLAQTVCANLELTSVDSRETGRVWIHQNLPGGARIAVESYAPYVDPDRFWVEGVGRMIEHDAQWYIDRHIEYMVFSQRMFMRFYRDPEMYARQIEQYEQLFNRFTMLKTLTDGGYEVRIYKTGIYD